MFTVFRRLAFVLLLAPSSIVFADKIDEFADNLIEKRHIPGLSLAIIKDGKVIKAAAYGVANEGSGSVVTTNTLFQAGSISKPVSALGALHLVNQNQLSLDEDVNVKLHSWKLPENDWTKSEKVTLRRILSHSAGLTVHGFPGYEVGRKVPSLVQVLDGAGAANTKPIRVDIEPGSKVRYSGGGYTLMQQLILDVTGKDFARYMDETVLKPLAMRDSTFEQPLPADRSPRAARGYYSKENPVKNGWHIYPEMAAAGLWTTPTDLACFAISIQKLFTGSAEHTLEPLVSRSLAREMLTAQKEGVGLGLFLEGSGKNLRFKHGGRDEGFDALLVAYAEQGCGAALMINSNDNTGALERMVEFVAREYAWPNYR